MLRRRLRTERGFTLIEVLIAATVAAVGLMAVMTTLDSSRDLVSTAERNEVASHEAEQEMERILSFMPGDYEQIGTTTAPTISTNVEDPRFYVKPGNRYRWNPSSTTLDENLVFGGTSTLPLMSNWSDGESRLSGQIWRFVTEHRVVAAPSAPPDAKRVTVAVTIDGDEAPTKPIVISSIVAAPVEEGP